MVIVYDCLSFFTDIIDGMIREGYDGYQILEDEVNDNYYVVYTELSSKRKEVKKAFQIDFKDIDEFIKLEKNYRNFFVQQKFLESVLDEVKVKIGNREIGETELENICNDIYYRDGNYLIFVALRMNANDFTRWVSEKLLKQESCLQ